MIAAALFTALFTALGCEDSGFVPPSLVLGPRLLAVVAEPPEVSPGEDVTLTPMTALAEGARFRMEVDLSVAALAFAAGQTLGEAGTPTALVVEDGRGRLDGDATAAAVDALFARIGDAPTGTPEAVVRQVYEEVGLTLPVRVEMLDADGAVIVEAIKRIVLTSRLDRTTNPPPPRFAIDGAWVVGAPDGFDCVPEGTAPSVAAGSTVTLSPEVETWLEPYPALDLEGQLLTGMENGYYSWFATGGDFALDVTRAPTRDAEWTAPEAPGVVPLWLVVRDGHLGASACRVEITVR